MKQQWRELAFLHWRVDPAVVAPLLPPGTRPDVHDGSTWVGLIPFRMVDAGVGGGPAVPWLGTFLETNVRLYSVDDHGRRGVVFRSLECERLGVVAGARAGFGTPYTWARMRLTRSGDVLTYTSYRRLPRPGGASSRVVVRPLGRRPRHTPLDDFLTARFGLHSRWLGRTLWVPNHHEPWELHDADLLALDDDLISAAGLPGVTGRPPDSVLWSPGVETVFGLPVVVAPRSRT